jgi:hypothetical protein
LDESSKILINRQRLLSWKFKKKRIKIFDVKTTFGNRNSYRSYFTKCIDERVTVIKRRYPNTRVIINFEVSYFGNENPPVKITYDSDENLNKK